MCKKKKKKKVPCGISRNFFENFRMDRTLRALLISSLTDTEVWRKVGCPTGLELQPWPETSKTKPSSLFPRSALYHSVLILERGADVTVICVDDLWNVLHIFSLTTKFWSLIGFVICLCAPCTRARRHPLMALWDTN